MGPAPRSWSRGREGAGHRVLARVGAASRWLGAGPTGSRGRGSRPSPGAPTRGPRAAKATATTLVALPSLSAMPSAKRIVGFNPFPFESFVANRVRESIKGPCSIFPIHKKYGGAGKYTWVHARGASIPGPQPYACPVRLPRQHRFDLRQVNEAVGVRSCSCSKLFLQVQPVLDSEEVAGKERTLARRLLVAVAFVELEGGDVAAGDV